MASATTSPNPLKTGRYRRRIIAAATGIALAIPLVAIPVAAQADTYKRYGPFSTQTSCNAGLGARAGIPGNKTIPCTYLGPGPSVDYPTGWYFWSLK